jgi:hypothetical protein
VRLQSCLRNECPDTRSSQWWTYPGRAHTTWPKRKEQSFSAQVLDVRLCSVNAYQSKARGIFTKGFRPTATGRHHFLHIEGTKRYFLHEHRIDLALNSTEHARYCWLGSPLSTASLRRCRAYRNYQEIYLVTRRATMLNCVPDQKRGPRTRRVSPLAKAPARLSVLDWPAT